MKNKYENIMKKFWLKSLLFGSYMGIGIPFQAPIMGSNQVIEKEIQETETCSYSSVIEHYDDILTYIKTVKDELGKSDKERICIIDMSTSYGEKIQLEVARKLKKQLFRNKKLPPEFITEVNFTGNRKGKNIDVRYSFKEIIGLDSSSKIEKLLDTLVLNEREALESVRSPLSKKFVDEFRKKIKFSFGEAIQSQGYSSTGRSSLNYKGKVYDIRTESHYKTNKEARKYGEKYHISGGCYVNEITITDRNLNKTYQFVQYDDHDVIGYFNDGFKKFLLAWKRDNEFEKLSQDPPTASLREWNLDTMNNLFISHMEQLSACTERLLKMNQHDNTQKETDFSKTNHIRINLASLRDNPNTPSKIKLSIHKALLLNEFAFLSLKRYFKTIVEIIKNLNSIYNDLAEKDKTEIQKLYIDKMESLVGKKVFYDIAPNLVSSQN